MKQPTIKTQTEELVSRAQEAGLKQKNVIGQSQQLYNAWKAGGDVQAEMNELFKRVEELNVAEARVQEQVEVLGQRYSRKKS